MSSGVTPEQAFPLDLEAELSAFVSGGGLRKFPTPGAAIEAGGIMWNVNYKTEDLAKVIARDKELAAEFLRRASSAALARAGGCTSVANAINRLGAEQTAFLLIAHRYGEQIAIDGPLLPLRARIWREGLAGARLCEALAKARRIAEHEGFLCGLNHDIGRAITVGCLEMILMGRRSVPAMPEPFWTDIIDRHHGTIGVAVADMWGMSGPLREVIAAHHRDSLQGLPRADLLEIVKVADSVNAALAQANHVSLDSLGKLPGLRGGEVAMVAKVIEDLPRYIADMERHSKKPLWGLVPIRPLVRRDEWAGVGARPLEAALTCVSGGKRQQYQAKEIAADRLLATGKDALREGFLVEVSLDREPEARFWAEVVCCGKRERGYEVELRPFALGEAELRTWSRIAPMAQTPT